MFIIGHSLRILPQWILILLSIQILSSCATTRFAPRPSSEAALGPAGILTVYKEGMIVNAVATSTPYNLGNRITTFQVTLVNPNEYNIDFYPKEYILWDQHGRQHFALGRDAMSEAAYAGSASSMHFGLGVGYGYYHPFHHPWNYGFYGYDPYYPRRYYQGLIANALPMKPITIYPHSTVTGNVYFAVPPRRLHQVSLVINRFTAPPNDPVILPGVISYMFDFNVFH